MHNGHSGSMHGRLALVTGAGSGIGRATATALASAGARVIVVDVDAVRVEAIASQLGASAVMGRQVDVGRREEMRALADEVHARFSVLDVLVNNAGVGHTGGILGTPLEHWDAVVQVNLWGAIHGCHFFVPKMVERGQGGHVVNVASVYGLLGAGGVAPYCTTKFALVGFSESLREELAPHRIGVTAVCPGLIATDIVQRGYFVDESRRAPTADVFAKRGHPPEKVARAIVSAIESNAALMPVGPEAWGMYYGKRAAPGFIGRVRRRIEEMGG
jgi:NAD(P)-dependent dehydrogenase (short-subunit alcohol dehydrogenase family)